MKIDHLKKSIEICRTDELTKKQTLTIQDKGSLSSDVIQSKKNQAFHRLVLTFLLRITGTIGLH